MAKFADIQAVTQGRDGCGKQWLEDPSFQVAGVRFSGVDTNADGKADSFSSNSTVEIVIIAGRFNGITDFKSHLAHELTHLIRGSAGNFLSESGVQQRENQTYDNIFAGFNMTDYEESIDYSVVMPGNQTDYYGTNGDNQFTDPGSYNQIYTAAGNDIVQSGDYSDLVVVNGSGLKFVIDYGSGWDVLEAQRSQRWLTSSGHESVSICILPTGLPAPGPRMTPMLSFCWIGMPWLHTDISTI